MSVSNRKPIALLAIGVACLFPGAPASEAQGRLGRSGQITIVVGYGAGGGYDTYARLIARFLPRYLPEATAVVVQNMTGAGSLSATQFLYGLAPKDGTVLGVIGQTIPIDHVLGQTGKTDFETSKFNWIGRMTSGVETVLSSAASKIKVIDDARNKLTPVAATGPSSGAFLYPTVLNNVLGTKFKIVSGYGGTREMLLALERGEVDAIGAIEISTVTSEFRSALDEGGVHILTQVSSERHPAIRHVPALPEFGRTPEEREALGLFAAGGDIGRALLAPPGVPRERVAELRAAFDAAMRDPDLLQFARETNIDVRPMSGDRLQVLVESIEETSASVIAKAVALKKPRI